MKNTLLILLTAICVLAAVSVVSAESGLYPIGQYQQPSYPSPQYNQPVQQDPYYYQNYNSPYYYYPYYSQPTATPTPVPTQQPYYYQYTQPQPYYYDPYYQQNQYYQPQPYYQQQPYYDPNSGYYFYQLSPQQPQPPYVAPQQPGYQDPNVQASTQWNNNGTLKLTWIIRNTTAEDWARSNVDIKCIGGCYLLTNPDRTLWDIPYTVRRNDKLSFSVNIRSNFPGETMTFAMVAGSKTLYTFNVRP